MSDFYEALNELELTDANSSAIVKILRALDSKLESLDLKFESLGAMVNNRMDHQASAFNVLIERSNPRTTSSCVFCGPESPGDGHNSGRCTVYGDAVSRAFQASKIGLCPRCLKAEHGGDCGVCCQNCRLPHNLLLCPSRGRPANHQAKKRKYWLVYGFPTELFFNFV